MCIFEQGCKVEDTICSILESVIFGRCIGLWRYLGYKSHICWDQVFFHFVWGCSANSKWEGVDHWKWQPYLYSEILSLVRHLAKPCWLNKWVFEMKDQFWRWHQVSFLYLTLQANFSSRGISWKHRKRWNQVFKVVGWHSWMFTVVLWGSHLLATLGFCTM